jgi:predicted Zn-dependent protease
MPENTLITQSKLAFTQLKQDSKLSYNSEYNSRVSRVGQRIAQVASQDLPQTEWEYVVFDDDSQINAFAMPGGKIGVYTGLLKLATTDDELAAVMGHEVAHVSARHGNQQISNKILLATGGLVAGYMTKDMESDMRKMIMSLYGVGGTLGSLRFSRSNETEADEIGLVYMAKAGYNPNAAVTFWQKMIQASGPNQVPTLLSTHPAKQDRIRNIQRLLPKAMIYYNR